LKTNVVAINAIMNAKAVAVAKDAIGGNSGLTDVV
jgi:hypothetical protein